MDITYRDHFENLDKFTNLASGNSNLCTTNVDGGYRECTLQNDQLLVHVNDKVDALLQLKVFLGFAVEDELITKTTVNKVIVQKVSYFARRLGCPLNRILTPNYLSSL